MTNLQGTTYACMADVGPNKQQRNSELHKPYGLLLPILAETCGISVRKIYLTADELGTRAMGTLLQIRWLSNLRT